MAGPLPTVKLRAAGGLVAARQAGPDPVACQYGLLELAQRRAWLDPEFLGEHALAGPVDLKGLGPAVDRVERAHELLVEPLTERVRAGQATQLRDYMLVPAAPQLGDDPVLNG